MNMNPMPQQPTQPGQATPDQVALFNSVFRENCPFKFVFGGVTGKKKKEKMTTMVQHKYLFDRKKSSKNPKAHLDQEYEGTRHFRVDQRSLR